MSLSHSMGLAAPGYLEHMPSVHLCLVCQRQTGHIFWLHFSHIWTMSFYDFVTFYCWKPPIMWQNWYSWGIWCQKSSRSRYDHIGGATGGQRNLVLRFRYRGEWLCRRKTYTPCCAKVGDAWWLGQMRVSWIFPMGTQQLLTMALP